MSDGIAHLDFAHLCDQDCGHLSGWVVSFGPCPACGRGVSDRIMCRDHTLQAVDSRSVVHDCMQGLVPVVTWRECK